MNVVICFLGIFMAAAFGVWQAGWIWLAGLLALPVLVGVLYATLLVIGLMCFLIGETPWFRGLRDSRELRRLRRRATARHGHRRWLERVTPIR